MKRMAVICVLASMSATGCATLVGLAQRNDVSVTIRGPHENIETTIHALPPIEGHGRQPTYILDSTGHLSRKPTDAPASTVRGASFNLALDRKHDYRLLVASPGYTSQQVTIGRSYNPWVWGNAASACSLVALGALLAISRPHNAYSTLALSYYSVMGLGLWATGSGIDWLTGFMWQHSPADLTIDLPKAAAARQD